MTLSRRRFLARGGLVGCSLAASPLLTPISFAAAPWDMRLVVIVLRGGMDGLDVVRPYGDKAFHQLRPGLMADAGTPALDLDGFYAMHPALAELRPMWAAGGLGFVHAVSTPYRDKRSHFDGQDLLEAGTMGLGQARDGWLNRMLTQVPGADARTAFAIGTGEMKLLQGAAPVAEWTPEADLSISPQAERLMALVMEEDPLFHSALEEALELSRTGAGAVEKGAKGHEKIAAYAAEQLRGQTRIAAFSLNGWDTHNAQKRNLGRALGRLSDCILTMQRELGPVWEKTAIVAMTEFGRTARENGTRGTDHGTAGAAVLAGGAIDGGRVWGDWPGLSESQLYNRRDLMPTGDVRAIAAWLMHAATGLPHSTLERVVFPGLDMRSNPRLLL